MAVWGLFGACVDVEQYDNNPRGNFEALWRIIDEHYCFFDYKKQAYGLDWNAVYTKYAPQFHDGMTEEQTFEVLTNMLGELKDGHVNLYAPFDVGRDWAWKEDYPIRQKGYVVPTVCTESKYYDMDTKKIFFSYTACRRKGSVLFRKIFDIDLGKKCRPKDLRYILIRLDAATLLEKGKMQ